MDSEILSLYTWTPGVCFRHPELSETDTVKVKTLHPRSSPDQDLRVCRRCLLALEAIRRAAAEGAGDVYEPGHVAE
ncbi:hypothetical protein ABZ208_13600 [Streptomyces sp. NPDC006208]|uniref:hypothetical protein n=1 Tax=Streptomyces sp. NPDC006208 TaxID=3156734 RepID=UPI0033AF8795